MNTTKKIAVVLAVMMVAAAMAAPAVMGVVYEATVTSTQNTALVSSDGAFGNIVAGKDETIAKSINLTNVGNVNAQVTASGANLVGVDPLNTIPIAQLKIDDVSVAVGGAVVIAAVPFDENVHSYAAKLTIPNLQAADSYSTTVTLEFANA